MAKKSTKKKKKRKTLSVKDHPLKLNSAFFVR